MATHLVVEVDEKILRPKDHGEMTQSAPEIAKHYAKPVRGYVFIEDSNGNVIDTPNLVLLKGREFLAQLLAGVPANADLNYLNYRVTHFGVGSGGADTAAIPSKKGPFDNDLDLAAPRVISAVNTIDTVDSTDVAYKYIKKGYLKNILADTGNIEVVSENHTFTINNVSKTIPAYTSIKYTMYVKAEELQKGTGSFAFNEAALYAVKYDPVFPEKPAMSTNTESSRYDPDAVCFARFTTLTKHIEPSDSFKITWYILL